MKPLLITALALAAPFAFADEKPIQLSIAAGKVAEVCMPLEAGDTLAWQFKASAALDFNLHHHVGSEVLMPVNKTGVAEDRAEHAVDKRNEWCLMWKAPAARAATVNGSWQVKKTR